MVWTLKTHRFAGPDITHTTADVRVERSGQNSAAHSTKVPRKCGDSHTMLLVFQIG